MEPSDSNNDNARIVDTRAARCGNLGESAKIVDTKKMISDMESSEKLSKMKITKKLNKIANIEVEDEFGKKKNPFQNLRISKSALKKKGGRKKKNVIDFDKFTVDNYTYDEFSKSVNSILPNVINHVSFKDEKFLTKLKASKDLKHFADSQIMFPITNDYLGGAGAILGCALEFYVENRINVQTAQQPPPSTPNLTTEILENSNPIL